MMWSHYDEFSWWWFVLMPLGMLGFWAVLIWVIVTLVRRDDRDRSEPPGAKAS